MPGTNRLPGAQESTVELGKTDSFVYNVQQKFHISKQDSVAGGRTGLILTTQWVNTWTTEVDGETCQFNDARVSLTWEFWYSWWSSDSFNSCVIVQMRIIGN